MSGASPQFERENARLLRDLQRDNRSTSRDIAALTSRVGAVELYVSSDLRTWLEALAAAVGFLTPYPEPPF